MSPADWDRGVIVVGAGAAGLWAAGVAARAGQQVLLLEKTSRTGTKILASGGTHCNLTTTLDPVEAARLFGRRGERFLRPAFDALPPLALRERFEALGVPTVEAPLEKVFPASGRARDVRDALEREAREAGVDIVFGAPVTAVRNNGEGFELEVEGGRRAICRNLLLCPGGKSYPRTGTTGDGYAWLESLGLHLVEPVPALVPLASSDLGIQGLAGIALQDAEVRACDGDGKTLARRSRPVLFTHRGLSGPGPMDVSVHVARGEAGHIRLDLVPGLDREELRGRLIELAGARGGPRLARALPELPRRLVGELSGSLGLGSNPEVSTLSRSSRHALVEAIKGWSIPVEGTLGWDQAEVTAGGLDLRAVNPRTMEVNAHPGLFVFGELLDLDGPIGGLNFQAAFACGELAGLALAGA